MVVQLSNGMAGFYPIPEPDKMRWHRSHEPYPLFLGPHVLFVTQAHTKFFERHTCTCENKAFQCIRLIVKGSECVYSSHWRIGSIRNSWPGRHHYSANCTVPWFIRTHKQNQGCGGRGGHMPCCFPLLCKLVIYTTYIQLICSVLIATTL